MSPVGTPAPNASSAVRPEEIVRPLHPHHLPAGAAIGGAGILARLRSGRRIDHYETERLRKDGSRVRVSLTISPVRDPEGRVVGASKIARDISERLHMQEAIIESEKLAATGRMAAAIAHEINNPLEAVTRPRLPAERRPHLSDRERFAHSCSRNRPHQQSGQTEPGLLPRQFQPRSIRRLRPAGKRCALNQSPARSQAYPGHPRFRQTGHYLGSISEIRQVFSNPIRNAD